MKSDRAHRSFRKAALYERSRTAMRPTGRGTLTGRLAGFFRLREIHVATDPIARQILAHARALEDAQQHQADRIRDLERQLADLRLYRRRGGT